MRRFGRGARSAPRRPSHAIGLDAGASTLRLWLGAATDLAERATPVVAARTISDRPEATGRLLDVCRDVIKRQLPRTVRRSRAGFAVAVAVPATASTSGRRSVETAVSEMNRGQPVLLMDAALAAAAGAGLDISSTVPRLVLDVGVHGSEAAVLADGRIIDAIAIGQGCHEIERAVLAHLYRQHHVLAAPHAAWRALRLGSAVGFTASDVAVPVRVSHPELAAQLSGPAAEITAAVRRLACRSGQRIGRDTFEQGLVVVGGGATVPLLLTTLAEELHCPVVAAPDPRRAVARGLGLLLGEAQRCPELWASP